MSLCIVTTIMQICFHSEGYNCQEVGKELNVFFKSRNLNSFSPVVSLWSRWSPYLTFTYCTVSCKNCNVSTLLLCFFSSNMIWKPRAAGTAQTDKPQSRKRGFYESKRWICELLTLAVVSLHHNESNTYSVVCPAGSLLQPFQITYPG